MPIDEHREVLPGERHFSAVIAELVCSRFSFSIRFWFWFWFVIDR
jgi:hypothetical protein